MTQSYYYYSTWGKYGSSYRNDYIELFNTGISAVSLDGWSLQYSTSSGSATWRVIPLRDSIQPGGHYFARLYYPGPDSDLGNFSPDSLLPDVASGTSVTNISPHSGKVALVASVVPLNAACPVYDPFVIDFVGYNTSTTSIDCFAGSAPAAASATISVPCPGAPRRRLHQYRQQFERLRGHHPDISPQRLIYHQYHSCLSGAPWSTFASTSSPSPSQPSAALAPSGLRLAHYLLPPPLRHPRLLVRLLRRLHRTLLPLRRCCLAELLCARLQTWTPQRLAARWRHYSRSS